MFETSKAVTRRNFDRRFATTYFVGEGIDIGCGQDTIGRYSEFYPLMKSVKSWDLPDGDGMKLESIYDDSFDFVHASHSLEHMQDPYEAMRNWIRVLRKGGYMILLLPDEDMFEQGMWPSVYTNGDHITSWTIKKKESWCPASINITEFFGSFAGELEILKIEKLDSTYAYDMEPADQTRGPIQECAIEIVLRKLTDIEISDKGRLPKKKLFTYSIG